jgi:hypothetical protein
MSQKVMTSGCPYTQTATAAQALHECSVVSASKKPVCAHEVGLENVFDVEQMGLESPKLLQRGMSETFDDLNTFLAGQPMGADRTFEPDWPVKLKTLEMLVEGPHNKSRVEAPLQDTGFARNAVSRRMEPKLESKIPPLSSSQEFELLTDGSVEALLLDAGFSRKAVSRRTEPKPESKMYPRRMELKLESKIGTFASSRDLDTCLPRTRLLRERMVSQM